MKKIKYLEKVSKFKTQKKSVYFIDFDGFWKFSENNLTQISINTPFDFHFYDQEVIEVNDLNIPIREIDTFSSLLKENSISKLSRIFENHIIFYERNPSRYFLLNIEKKEILIFSKDYFSIQFGQIFYSLFNNDTTLFAYSENGNQLWEYTLPEGVYDFEVKFNGLVKGAFEKFFGEYDGVVWLNINLGHLMGLSVKDGTLMYDIDYPINFTDFYEQTTSRFWTAPLAIDFEKGLMFGKVSNFYWDMDLKNPKETFFLYNIEDAIKKQGVDDNWEYHCFTKNEIFFSLWSFAKDPTFVFIFDRDTRQITWTSQELGEEGIFAGINKVDYADGRLYVLDRNSTLHIFER